MAYFLSIYTSFHLYLGSEDFTVVFNGDEHTVLNTGFFNRIKRPFWDANLCDINNSLFAGHMIHFCSEENFKMSSCAHLSESYTLC